MAGMIWLLLSLALADEPAAPADPAPAPAETPAPSPLPDDPSDTPVEPTPQPAPPAAEAPEPEPPPSEPEVVVIWGEHQVRQARAQVVRDLEALGWRARGKNREGMIKFKPPSSWMGRMTLHPDGRVDFSRPVLKGRWAKKEGDTEQELAPAVWVLPSGKKLEAVHQEVFDAIRTDLRQYEVILQETLHQQALQALPERLDALWKDGVPLEGGRTLSSWEDKRAAVLDHWATRADTREGDNVSQAIEVWLREVVQTSDQPVTAAERSAAEARRADGRPLSL